MEKDFKSCTVVLLRADLAGNGHSSPSKRVGWPCPLKDALQDFHSFSIMFYFIISATYQKI
jgi:hypothetical protein